MQSNREVLLCHYHYDPLDRLTTCTPSGHASTQRYYLKDRLASEIQGVVQHSFMQFDDQLLAQQRRQDGAVETNMLATDLQRSVLAVLDLKKQASPLSYTPYGHHPVESGLLSLLGFNGERRDSVTGHYLLGNGYRAFNPMLMRFNSPDNLSPFGKGGFNSYTYCVGDPVNWSDPTGHMRNPFRGLLSRNPRASRASSAPAASSAIASPTTPVSTVPAGRQPPQYTEIDPNRPPPPPYFETATNPSQVNVDNSRLRSRLESQLHDLQIQHSEVHPSQRTEVEHSIVYVETRLAGLSRTRQQNDAIRTGTTLTTPTFSLVPNRPGLRQGNTDPLP